MTTITRENAEIKSFITGFLSDAAHDKQSSNSLLANVFRIALASLEAEPVAWRYRYVKKGVTDYQGESWVGDWKYVPTKEDCNDRPNYEIQALFTAQPVPLTQEVLNLEKARMQLRVLLSGPVPAITPMAHAVAIKVVLDALDASERRVAELEQVCTAAGIRIKGEQVK